MTVISRPTDSRKLRPTDRRAQLIQAAASLFRQRGFADVSVADIASAAGVTGPSIYRHFADKQAILGAAVLASVADLQVCTDAALLFKPSVPGHDGLMQGLSALTVSDPDAAVLWRWSGRNLTEATRTEVKNRSRVIMNRWADQLRVDDPSLSADDAQVLAWALLSVAGSVAMYRSKLSPTRQRECLRAVMARVLFTRPSEVKPLNAMQLMDANPHSRQEEILDAASALFASRDYPDVGVDDIGAAVGMSGPSVYNHFPSKVAILLAICQRAANRLTAGRNSVEGGDPGTHLAQLVESYVSVLTQSNDLTVSFTCAMFLLGEPRAIGLLEMERDYVRFWVTLLMRVDDTLTKDTARVAVHGALTLANDLVRMRRMQHRDNLPAELTTMMCAALGIENYLI